MVVSAHRRAWGPLGDRQKAGTSLAAALFLLHGRLGSWTHHTCPGPPCSQQPLSHSALVPISDGPSPPGSPPACADGLGATARRPARALFLPSFGERCCGLAAEPLAGVTQC